MYYCSIVVPLSGCNVSCTMTIDWPRGTAKIWLQNTLELQPLAIGYSNHIKQANSDIDNDNLRDTNCDISCQGYGQ